MDTDNSTTKLERLLRLYLPTIARLTPRQLVYQVYRYIAPASKVLASPVPEYSPIPSLLSATAADTCNKNGTMYVLNHPVYDLDKSVFLRCESDYLPQFSFFYFSWAITEDVGTVRNLLLQSLLWSDMKYFMHPYVVSKRLINLTLLMSLDRSELSEMREQILSRIWGDYQFLRRNKEFHIGANHLLTNRAALAVASKIIDLKNSARLQLLYWREFQIQFRERLHFERSPAYSAQLLNEALVVYQISEADVPCVAVTKLIGDSISFLLLLNVLGLRLNFVDNIWMQSPTANQLACLSRRLGLELQNLSISSAENECGFVLFHRGQFAAALDAGIPSPSHQPGHTHDATAGVEVAFNAQPLLVNPDITTYERSVRRIRERSRLGHSTIQSCGEVQGVWSAFRVARRVRPLVAVGRHEGACKFGRGNWTGSRHLQLFDGRVLITDRSSHDQITSRYFIAPGVAVDKLSEAKLGLELLTGERLVFEAVNGTCLVAEELWGNDYGAETLYTVINVEWNTGEGSIEMRMVNE